jgi:hypothetical protein
MKNWFSFVLTCSLLACSIGLSQDRPIAVSLIQLIVNPEKFDGKVVAVKGFLRIDHEDPNHHGTVLLYLNQEEARNLLDSSILVVPNDQMSRDEEKIDRKYVWLVASFHAVRAANGAYTSVIKEVQSCTPWSDPQRPIGERGKHSNLQSPK